MPRSDAYLRLRRLNWYPLLEERLLSGWPPSTLALLIRAKGESLDITKRSLERTLHRLRSELDSEAKARQKKLHELAELAVAVRAQRHRIKVSIAIEEQIGSLLPGTGEQVRILGEMLKKSSDLKFDLGIYKRVPRGNAA